MPRTRRDLREDCIAEGMAIVATEGLEKLSLREVARRLGVSHQAPYKHFASRDHILAEMVSRSFDAFAGFLDAHPKSNDPDQDMANMAEDYLRYAREHPLEYRLMFGTPLPDGKAFPEMMAKAKHAFSLLVAGLKRKARLAGEERADEAVLLDALVIWASLHGLASLKSSSIMATLDLAPMVIARSAAHMIEGFAAILATNTHNKSH
jgi:AcrR family transcriptional regulator